MEIILIALAFGLALWWFFLRRPEEKPQVFQAPYKVETPPEPTPAPTPEPVVEVKVEEPTPAPAPVVEAMAEPAPKRARNTKGKFKGDDKLTAETNEAWEGGKAPAKKPRKPRAPKAEKPVKEKAAKPKKVAAMTAKKTRSKKA